MCTKHVEAQYDTDGSGIFDNKSLEKVYMLYF